MAFINYFHSNPNGERWKNKKTTNTPLINYIYQFNETTVMRNDIRRIDSDDFLLFFVHDVFSYLFKLRCCLMKFKLRWIWYLVLIQGWQEIEYSGEWLLFYYMGSLILLPWFSRPYFLVIMLIFHLRVNVNLETGRKLFVCANLTQVGGSPFDKNLLFLNEHKLEWNTRCCLLANLLAIWD